jgi:hypothetical protein
VRVPSRWNKPRPSQTKESPSNLHPGACQSQSGSTGDSSDRQQSGSESGPKSESGSGSGSKSGSESADPSSGRGDSSVESRSGSEEESQSGSQDDASATTTIIILDPVIRPTGPAN